MDSVISVEWLKKKLRISEEKELPFELGCCIYRVPTKFRKDNEEAYTPTLISIGPYHYRDKRLESMKDFKFWFFNVFVKRNPEKELRDYIEAMRKRVYEIRKCYSETIKMTDDVLVCMILMDACFIIEFFIALTASPEGRHVLNPWQTEHIKLDLLLLENQIPFFVLEDLFNLACPNGLDDGTRLFAKLAFNFFKKEYLGGSVSTECDPTDMHVLNYFGCSQVYHLNNMLRMFFLPDKLPKRESHIPKPICSASQLREAGIKFKASEKSNRTKVHFSNGVLTLPCFRVRDRTETMIRNVIAFEQCHPRLSSWVTDFVMLWDHLINTEKDVDLLVQKGIIENFLSDNNAVASMVNRLCRNVVSTSYNSEYIDLFKRLNKFYNNPYHKYKAIFRHEYVSTPWRIASFVAAIVLLFLTLIQTICSLVPLFHIVPKLKV
ncbi:hypothetical protein QN277_024817 [Acacia crassicarpa]|uniref:Uncharacterized protein n=1 Tax=Acacia crassicarpa TaxID=499986 RepID=A0AAE1MHQ0_9FABA|nr:hypothetical protein QN277_024817 [Acacia crassicarpa]